MRIGTLRATVVGAVVIALSGCAGGDPLPTLPPTPTATPIFASEEEALAAAEEAYAAYLEVSSLIANEGGVDPERIAPFVTEEQLPDELEGARYLADNGLRTEGATSLRQVELQQYANFDLYSEVAFYACVDAAAVRVFNSDGADVTPDARPVVIALEVVLRVTDEARLIEDNTPWPDSSFCL
jgi:hypothetical protein